MAECKIGKILSGNEAPDGVPASEAEKRALAEALADKKTWPANSLSNRVTNNTRFSFGATTVKDHRRQECCCFND